VNLIEPVQVPTKPVSPRIFLNLVLGLIIGALGSIMLAFLLNYLDDRLETPESIENCLKAPVLISIPYKPDNI
jgi:capsular polysaccharide biosynthesis protein